MTTQTKHKGPSPAEITIRRNKGVPMEKKRCILYVTTDGKVIYGYFEELPSFLIGGMPKQGKTSAMVFYACQIVSAGGQLIVIDPHYGAPRDSLGTMLEPLEAWFAKPILNYNDVEPSEVVAYFQYVLDEFLTRKKKNGTVGKKVLFLCVDEWNELLECMPIKERAFIIHVVSTVARAGRKYGIHLALAGQQWQLSVSGGNSVRGNVQGRISFNAEFSAIKRVLDTYDTETLKRLLGRSLPTGDAILKLPGADLGGIIRVRYPYFNRDACVNIAKIMRRIYTDSEYPTQEIHVFENEHSESESYRASTLEIVPIDRSESSNSVVPETLNLNLNHVPETLNQTLETLNREHKNLKISDSEFQEIIRLGNQQIRETHKVIRKQIVDAMGGNSHTSRKVKVVCDLLNWHQAMDVDELDSDVWEYIKKQSNYTCQRCKRKEPDVKLEPDRITPHVKGGKYTPDNVQCLCKHCNSGKRDRIVDYRQNIESEE